MTFHARAWAVVYQWGGQGGQSTGAPSAGAPEFLVTPLDMSDHNKTAETAFGGLRHESGTLHTKSLTRL